MTEPGEGLDQQGLLSKRAPVALGILEQLVRLRNPHRSPAALEPVVEKNACDLSPLARAGAVAKEPALAEADGCLAIVGCSLDLVVGGIDGPFSGQMC